MSWRLFLDVGGDGMGGIKPDPDDKVSLGNIKMVYAYLAMVADANGVAYPAIKTVADYWAIGQSAVRRAYTVLDDQGVIVADGGRSRGGSPTRWRITTPRVADRVTDDPTPRPTRGVPDDPTPRVPDPTPRVSASNPASSSRRNHQPPERSSGGGGEGLTPSPDGSGAALAIVDRIKTKVGAEIATADKLVRAIGERIDAGWSPDQIVTQVVCDWPKKIKSSATGVAIKRVQMLPAEPPAVTASSAPATSADRAELEELADKIQADARVIYQCTHGAEDEWTTGRHETEFNGELGVPELGDVWDRWVDDDDRLRLGDDTDLPPLHQVRRVATIVGLIAADCRRDQTGADPSEPDQPAEPTTEPEPDDRTDVANAISASMRYLGRCRCPDDDSHYSQFLNDERFERGDLARWNFWFDDDGNTMFSANSDTPTVDQLRRLSAIANEYVHKCHKAK